MIVPDQEQQQPRLPGAQPVPGQPASAARRRFGRAGAAVAVGGVLATLKSQPGMACTVCVTPSGYQSIKTGSPNPRAANKCQGVPASSWIAASTWPSGINRNTFKFKDAFTTTTGVSATGNTMLSLMKVGSDAECSDRDYNCQRSDSSLSNTAWMMKYLCANYLNMVSGKMPFLSMEILNGIWTGWCKNQSYVPSAGAKTWYIAELKEYLSGTV